MTAEATREATSKEALSPDSDGKPSELPSLDFATFVLGIIGSAYVHLGDAPNPEGVLEQDFELARQNIEILNILHDKTKGES